MIISDLQYIESVNEEVLGGHGGHDHDDHDDNGNGGKKPWKKRKPFNQAGADATAEAFGFNTKAFTVTDTLTVKGEFSGAYSSSYSEVFH